VPQYSLCTRRCGEGALVADVADVIREHLAEVKNSTSRKIRGLLERGRRGGGGGREGGGTMGGWRGGAVK
jgi:hypothetical protein